MSEYVLVLTTTDSDEAAREIADTLVRERLAACVKIAGPVRSTYWWKDEIETAVEWQCWAKTRWDRYQQVEDAIRRLHSYEVPEILALPVQGGYSDYLEWVDLTLAGEG